MAKVGRPRALTLEQVRQRQPLEAQNNKQEVKDTSGINSLAELKGLYLHHGSNGHKRIQEGLGVTPSP